MVFKLFIVWCGLLAITVSATASCKRDSEEKQSKGQSSFKELLGVVNGDSLTYGGMQRLFSKLHFFNCNDSKPSADYRKCFTPTDLYNFHGSSPSKALNSTEFNKISPLIVYCLLPTPERARVPRHCAVPKNYSELYNSIARNFSKQGEQSITHKALNEILEEINKTIGEYLHDKKCFSAESIIKEIKGDHHDHGKEKEEEKKEHDEDHHDEEDEHNGIHHHEDKNQILDQDDFQKASARIILHLVQGFCIEKLHGYSQNGTKSRLPSKEFFIKHLFKEKERLSEEDLEEITQRLRIGKVAEAKTSSSSGGDSHGDDDHELGHRRRRSAGSIVLPLQGSTSLHTVHPRAAVDEHGHHTNGYQTNGTRPRCFSLDDLLAFFGIDRSVGVDACVFKELCPALIQQATSGACKASHQEHHVVKEKHLHMGKVWGYGFLSVTIISITSLVGVATIPFLGKAMYKKILATLVALAVGSLAGDSLLHLLPHAFGLHGHKEEGHGHNPDEHEDDKGFVWKALLLMASIFVFFIFETLMHLSLKGKDVDKKGHSHIDVEIPGSPSRPMNVKNKRNCLNFDHHEGSQTDAKIQQSISDSQIILTNLSAVGDLGLDNLGGPQDEAEEQQKSNMSLNSAVSEEEKPNKKTSRKVSAVAWMILVGDVLHNIADGLAIGAAFSEGGNSGISGGISTSVAVFCHELPHELGDFAVLITSGMSVKMALMANLLSALSCYIGLAIGIYVGQESNIRLWMFAIAAGMFLYIALVDMLPDLMHSETLQTEPVATFLCQNIGLLLGISIMLVIALYEEHLMAIQV